MYYAATQAEAQACGTGPVAIVGGGNSAGQAALFLSRTSTEVHVIIRGDTLQTSMSRYLIDQIERNPRIIVTPRTQITALAGKDQLEGVELRDTRRQQSTDLMVRGLFVFIGAQPRTEWLAGQLAEDSHGFLLTGTNIPQARSRTGTDCPCSWKPAGPGSSPSATSAAAPSSAPRPQSGKARWRCGSSSNASRPPGVRSQTRPAPTARCPIGHARAATERYDFLTLKQATFARIPVGGQRSCECRETFRTSLLYVTRRTGRVAARRTPRRTPRVGR